ncbi:hypothetical protein N9901_02665 [Flavobacteriaceae bacterium]|nr:hypothetical protein [Flavobacteriaceae bacterium]
MKLLLNNIKPFTITFVLLAMEDNFTNSEDFLKAITSSKNVFKTPTNYFKEVNSETAIHLISAEFPKEQGFNIPTDYFNNLEDSLKTKLITDSLPKSSGFNTPENYFETFKVKKKTSKVISLVPYLSTAAVVAFGIFLFSNSTTSTTYATYSNNEIVAYLNDHQDIDYTDIIDADLKINTENIELASLDINLNSMDITDIQFDEFDF